MGNNWDLIGHQWARDLLKNQIKTKRLRHAYLFLGPDGIGRRDITIAFAKAINCHQPNSPGEYCNQCRVCLQIDRAQHPDYFLIQHAEGDRGIKVSAIRELQHSLALAPYDAEYRIATILNFQDATDSAANALLKTLEEPAPKVILLLSAETSESLLPTIVSRCEIVRLRPLGLDALAEQLILHDIPADMSHMLAHASGGRPAYARSLHDQPRLLSQRSGWLEDHKTMLHSDRRNRFKFAEHIAKDKTQLAQILHVWLSLWRDVLIKIIGADIPVANLDQSELINDIAANHHIGQARDTISNLQYTLSLLETNTNTRLAAEILLLDLPKMQAN